MTEEHTDDRGRCLRCGSRRSTAEWWGEPHCDNYSAPVLLEALQEARAALVRCGEEPDGTVRGRGNRQHTTIGMWERMDAAIALATGVQVKEESRP